MLLNKVYDMDIEKYSDEAAASIFTLKELYKKQGLFTDSVALILAETAVHYQDINQALELLKPLVDNDTVLAYTVPLMYYQEAFNSNTKYFQDLVELSKQISPELWCNMFMLKCKIPFQALDNKEVRDIFCRECLDKNEFIKELYE